MYAFRRVQLHDRTPSYPLDPDGSWFHAIAVDAAEKMFRGSSRTRPKLPPGPLATETELANHFRRQDDERARLKARIAADRLPDGTVTPECAAFVRCCVRQVEENATLMERRNRVALAQPGRRVDPRAYDGLAEALGVTSAPKEAWQDDDAVRRAAQELGLGAAA